MKAIKFQVNQKIKNLIMKNKIKKMYQQPELLLRFSEKNSLYMLLLFYLKIRLIFHVKIIQIQLNLLWL